MDRDLVRLKRRQSFADRRLEIWEEIKTKYPEGMTKDNFEQIKKKIQGQEKKVGSVPHKKSTEEEQ